MLRTQHNPIFPRPPSSQFPVPFGVKGGRLPMRRRFWRKGEKEEDTVRIFTLLSFSPAGEKETFSRRRSNKLSISFFLSVVYFKGGREMTLSLMTPLSLLLPLPAQGTEGEGKGESQTWKPPSPQVKETTSGLAVATPTPPQPNPKRGASSSFYARLYLVGWKEFLFSNAAINFESRPWDPFFHLSFFPEGRTEKWKKKPERNCDGQVGGERTFGEDMF